jgi:hypothetical protein
MKVGEMLMENSWIFMADIHATLNLLENPEEAS